jgi:hypothetical protein
MNMGEVGLGIRSKLALMIYLRSDFTSHYTPTQKRGTMFLRLVSQQRPRIYSDEFPIRFYTVERR